MYEKEYKFGEATVIIHSPLANLTDEERGEWMRKEYEKGNPILLNIEKAVNKCYRSYTD